MNPKVDFYFTKAKKWQEEITHLRQTVLQCGLTEELKWGVPCYTFESANIVLIHTFKDYCALLFFKGALLKNAHNILIQQTENVQAARQIRFTGIAEIIKMDAIVQSYIYEAVEVEKAKLKVPLKKTAAFAMPEEFAQQISGKAGKVLKAAFEGLTPGRQRAYLLHFSAPKQAKTRQARIEKCTAAILEGKGLND